MQMIASKITRNRAQPVAPSRLEQVLGAYKPGIDRLALRLGWPTSKLSKLKNGKQGPTLHDLVMIAYALDIPVSELLDPSHLAKGHHDVVTVPIVPVDVLSSLNRRGILSLRETWGGPTVLVPKTKSSASFAIDYTENGMSRVIRPGSQVIIDPEQIQPEHGRIYLLLHGGKAILREYRCDSDVPRWHAQSITPIDDIFADRARAPITIIGRATDYVGTL